MKGLSESETPVFGDGATPILGKNLLIRQDPFTFIITYPEELVVKGASLATTWWSAAVATHYGANLRAFARIPVLPNPAGELPDNNPIVPYQK
jgi:hypothetical protein